MTLQSIDEYGPSFQMKVISSLLTHKEFLQNINDVLSDEYFSNPAHKWVINQIIQYYEKYHTTISMDILKVEMKKMDNEVLKVSVKEQLREAYRADIEDLEYVQSGPDNFRQMVRDSFFDNEKPFGSNLIKEVKGHDRYWAEIFFSLQLQTEIRNPRALEALRELKAYWTVPSLEASCIGLSKTDPYFILAQLAISELSD
jgi:hypothetical protein